MPIGPSYEKIMVPISSFHCLIRLFIIIQDAEAKRIALANILAAYLELILSFPMDQFELTAPMLEYGYTRLMKCASDPLLLQRIEAFSNKRDTV